MFKLPAMPTGRAGIHELADFSELLAWQHGSASVREILAHLGQVGDNEFNEGADDEDDQNAETLDEVMNEIDRRAQSCVDGYPFYLDLNGTVVRHRVVNDFCRADVYRYLLLSTRLNMKDDRIQDGIDGTALLEELAAIVLRCYLGYERAQSFVFGTVAGSGRFEEKINRLCREIGEGGRFSNIDQTEPDAKDDKLDVVAWVPFTDGRSGKLAIFCQCKTGTNWRDGISQLQPDAFLYRWTSDRRFVVNPVRAFCISEAVNTSDWNGKVIYAGLLFDRLRLVDYFDRIDQALVDRVRRWNVAAAAKAATAMTRLNAPSSGA